MALSELMRKNPDSPRKRKRFNQTAYPNPQSVYILGAPSSVLYNQSIECWSMVLARASSDNEQDFLPEDWELLARVFAGTLFETTYWSAGEQLASGIEDAVSYLGAGDPRKSRLLAGKLRKMDFVHAWAVIWAVQFHDRYHDLINEKPGDWWTLAYRRAMVMEQEGE